MVISLAINSVLPFVRVHCHCRIWGSHSGVYEEYHLLGRSAVISHKMVLCIAIINHTSRTILCQLTWYDCWILGLHIGDCEAAIFWDITQCSPVECFIFYLHNSWYRYNIRFSIFYMFRPDWAIFRYIRSHNRRLLFLLHSQCLHIGSVFYSLYMMTCCETYWILNIWNIKILKFLVLGILKLGSKLRLGWC
jgi:hypothetical protein